ncbi:swr complex subunit [Saitoella coloradoensis]
MSNPAKPIEDPDLDSEEDDEDFNPDAAGAQVDSDNGDSSDDEDEPPKVDEAGIDSGDEAVASSLGKRKRKAKGAEEVEGGEGGLIKTRAQRAREQHEKKSAVATGPVTQDINALWAAMNSKPSPSPAPLTTSPSIATESTPGPVSDEAAPAHSSATASASAVAAPVNEEGGHMIKIKRTYEFAGETITEEIDVPADSASARAYLASTKFPTAPSSVSITPTSSAAASTSATTVSGTLPPKRAPPRKRVSALESASTKAPKLNTLEKSRLDWASYVDKEGISEELKRHNKDGFVEKQGFLRRAEEAKVMEVKEGQRREAEESRRRAGLP